MKMHQWKATLGAVKREDGRCQFRVWAPFAEKVELHLVGEPSTANGRYLPMQQEDRGYFTVVTEVMPGQKYMYRLDEGQEFPDPASRFQPEGVFGPSQVVYSHFEWTDEEWRGTPLQEYIIYEMHVGTFTPEGSFRSAIQYLDRLVELGVTAVEVMPVNQFSGARGWGYDGVFLFAVQNSYGAPDDFRAFVDACHQRNLPVILDVVYNHFGPEGNCVYCFGPYMTDRYKTPWGDAVNFDGPHSDEVRAFFIENALHWIHDYHVDALRLDAVHEMYDFSANPFLKVLQDSIRRYRQQAGSNIYLMLESDFNDPNLVRARELGGYGFDAQWNDDFHHSLHTLVTYESQTYYQDYGEFQQLVKSLREGFVYDGLYSASRKRTHGASAADIPVQCLIVFFQNHDQIGNRMPNERAIDILPFDAFKLAIGLVLLSPYIPMLFMGDEYGETREFEYFVDYQDQGLIEAVRKGRRETFGMRLPDGVNPPDPQGEDTFMRSKLNWQALSQSRGRLLFDFHRALISLRKTIPALAQLERSQLDVHDDEANHVVGLSRWAVDSHVYAAFNFSPNESRSTLPVPAGQWAVRLNSAAPRWQENSDDRSDGTEYSPLISDGRQQLTLPPFSCVLLERS
jgi:maltooligosyltrehalose trehalohydrolase